MLNINPKKKEDQETIFLLCKGGAEKEVIEEYLDHVQIVNRFMIGAIILSEPSLSVIRRELRKISPGLKVGEEEIGKVISAEVLKRDVMEGEASNDAMKRIKKVARKEQRTKESKKKKDVIADNISEADQ